MKNRKIISIHLHHISGWYGSIAIIGAYFLGSFGILQPETIPYQLINLTGALGLFYLSYRLKVKESMFLNGFWIVIAGISLLRIII